MNDIPRVELGSRGCKCYDAGSIECVPRGGDGCNNTGRSRPPGPCGKSTLSGAVPLAGFETGASNGRMAWDRELVLCVCACLCVSVSQALRPALH